MRDRRRIAGWALVAAGGAALLVGASPLFPVVGRAFLVGGALLAAGLWLLIGRQPGARSTGSREPRAPADPLVVQRLQDLARRTGGVLSAAQAARELGVRPGAAEAGLEECVRSGLAFAGFDAARGGMFYTFPGASPGDESGAQR
jgi:hypothetical protein